MKILKNNKFLNKVFVAIIVFLLSLTAYICLNDSKLTKAAELVKISSTYVSFSGEEIVSIGDTTKEVKAEFSSTDINETNFDITYSQTIQDMYNSGTGVYNVILKIVPKDPNKFVILEQGQPKTDFIKKYTITQDINDAVDVKITQDGSSNLFYTGYDKDLEITYKDTYKGNSNIQILTNSEILALKSSLNTPGKKDLEITPTQNPYLTGKINLEVTINKQIVYIDYKKEMDYNSEGFVKPKITFIGKIDPKVSYTIVTKTVFDNAGFTNQASHLSHDRVNKVGDYVVMVTNESRDKFIIYDKATSQPLKGIQITAEQDKGNRASLNLKVIPIKTPEFVLVPTNNESFVFNGEPKTMETAPTYVKEKIKHELKFIDKKTGKVYSNLNKEKNDQQPINAGVYKVIYTVVDENYIPSAPKETEITIKQADFNVVFDGIDPKKKHPKFILSPGALAEKDSVEYILILKGGEEKKTKNLEDFSNLKRGSYTIKVLNTSKNFKNNKPITVNFEVPDTRQVPLVGGFLSTLIPGVDTFAKQIIVVLTIFLIIILIILAIVALKKKYRKKHPKDKLKKKRDRKYDDYYKGKAEGKYQKKIDKREARRNKKKKRKTKVEIEPSCSDELPNTELGSSDELSSSDQKELELSSDVDLD